MSIHCVLSSTYSLASPKKEERVSSMATPVGGDHAAAEEHRHDDHVVHQEFARSVVLPVERIGRRRIDRHAEQCARNGNQHRILQRAIDAAVAENHLVVGPAELVRPQRDAVFVSADVHRLAQDVDHRNQNQDGKQNQEDVNHDASDFFFARSLHDFLLLYRMLLPSSVIRLLR